MPVLQWLQRLVKGPFDWRMGGRVGASWEAFHEFQRGCHRDRKLGQDATSLCEELLASHEARQMGLCAILAAVVLSLLAAWALEKYFETPVKLWLRARRREKPVAVEPKMRAVAMHACLADSPTGKQ